MPRIITVSQLADIIISAELGKELEPEEFCNTWIIKLYGIEPGSDLYRKACVLEMTRYYPTEYDTAYRNWQWTKGRAKYPNPLPAFLLLQHKLYLALEALGNLPRYTLERGK